eukprot:jgi/Mesvir1/27150/Mv25928-RA.1
MADPSRAMLVRPAIRRMSYGLIVVYSVISLRYIDRMMLGLPLVAAAFRPQGARERTRSPSFLLKHSSGRSVRTAMHYSVRPRQDLHASTLCACCISAACHAGINNALIHLSDVRSHVGKVTMSWWQPACGVLRPPWRGIFQRSLLGKRGWHRIGGKKRLAEGPAPLCLMAATNLRRWL